MLIENPVTQSAVPLRVLWVHNFDPGIPVSGVFMHKLADAVQALGVRVDMLYTGNLSNPIEVWRARSHLRWLAPEFDVVHAQYGSMCAWIASAAPARKLLSIRGSDWYNTDSGPWSERRHGMMANFLTRRAIPRYDHVVTMSERMRRDIQNHFANAGPAAPAIEVLTDGLSLSDFVPLDRTQCRAALGFAGDERPWVLVTSVFEDNPVKRIGLARAAVEEARTQIPDIQIKVATNVSHTDMPIWMSACNLTLMTSLHEGWPNAIKEGLACGIPFVATDISDLPEIAKEEPSCVIAADNPQDLGRAIVYSLQHPPQTDLRRFVQHMDLQRVAYRLCEIYFEMVTHPCAA